jgi:hypothetical protein
MRVYLFLAVAAGLVLASGCASDKTTTGAQPVPEQPRSAYNRPLISPGAKFAGLPPAVQHTIRAQAGASEILDIIKIPNEDNMVYKVLFVKGQVFPPLFVSMDGSVLNPDFTVAKAAPPDMFSLITGASVAGVSINDLPPAVMKVIQARAPKSEIDYIDKEARGDQTVYVVSFKDKKTYPRMHIASDGTVLKTTAP